MKKQVYLFAKLSLLLGLLATRVANAADSKLKGLLGFESYCLREFSFERVVSTTRQLGLDHVEVLAGHIGPASEPVKIDEALRQLSAANVKISAAFVGNVGVDSK